MFGTSRLINAFRFVMPYAQWVAAVIQLGYVGYATYQVYQFWQAQQEADLRSGRDRTFRETVELVIKPLRKQVRPSRATNNPMEDQENRENQRQSVNGTNSADNHLNRLLGRVPIPLGWHDGTGAIKTRDLACRISEPSDEVEIVYDSSRRPLELQPSTSNLVQGERLLADCDVESIATSIESTDSNKGIISDVYSECFICARSLDDPERPVATLPFCMHPFHQTCLDGVLKWHPKCPVCDFHIFSPI